jgi:hypothetical protein
MEYEGMRAELVASGCNIGSPNNGVEAIGSATGAGAGAGFAAGFLAGFFLGFLPPIMAARAPPLMQQRQSAKNTHNQMFM